MENVLHVYYKDHTGRVGRVLPRTLPLPFHGINKSFIGSEGPFRLAIPSTGGKSVPLGVVAPPW
jgi:hypothetical protein